LFSYPCVKMVEFHHPGFLFSMVFKSTRLVASILVVDISGKSHCSSFAPHVTISNLRSQINSKFKLTSDLYGLSSCGKPLHDFVPFKEVTGVVIINGHLTGGAESCLRGCKNEVHVGTRKYDSILGSMKLNVTLMTSQVIWKNVKNLKVCDKHYVSLS